MKYFLYVMFFTCCSYCLVLAENKDHSRRSFFDTVRFVGVYKMNENRECIMAIGDEDEVENRRPKKMHKKFKFVLITKGGGSVMQSLDGLEEKFEEFDLKQFKPLSGMSAIDVFVEMLKVIEPRANQ